MRNKRVKGELRIPDTLEVGGMLEAFKMGFEVGLENGFMNGIGDGESSGERVASMRIAGNMLESGSDWSYITRMTGVILDSFERYTRIRFHEEGASCECLLCRQKRTRKPLHRLSNSFREMNLDSLLVKKKPG